MKRYRLNPDMVAVYGTRTVLHKDEEGNLVKYEDMIKVLKELADCLGYIMLDDEAKVFIDDCDF